MRQRGAYQRAKTRGRSELCWILCSEYSGRACDRVGARCCVFNFFNKGKRASVDEEFSFNRGRHVWKADDKAVMLVHSFHFSWEEVRLGIAIKLFN